MENSRIPSLGRLLAITARRLEEGMDTASTADTTAATTADMTSATPLAIGDELDFNDQRQVEAELARLGAQALARLPTRFSDGRDDDGLGRALASLLLARHAGQSQESTQWIAPGREDAGRMLSEHLSPTGQEALLQSAEGGYGENEFSSCFGEADRCYLAGHLYLQRANAGRVTADSPLTQKQVVENYMTAADAFTQAHADDEALVAYRAVAAENPRAGRHGLAGDAWRRAAELYAECRELERASDANVKAGEAYRRAALDDRIVDRLPAADYFLMAARAHEAGQANAQEWIKADKVKTGIAYAEDALYPAWTKVHESLRADAYVKAAEACLADKQYAAATDAFYRAKAYGQALEPCVMAASDYLATDQLAQAAETFMQLGELRGLAQRPLSEQANAFLVAAAIYVNRKEYAAAANACQAAGNMALAGRYYEEAHQFYDAAYAFKVANKPEDVARCYRSAGRPAPHP